MKNFLDIDLKLCHSCGTCIAVCPTEAIVLEDETAKLKGKCTNCALCYTSCPGIEFSYPEYNQWLFGITDVDKEIGYARSLYNGYAAHNLIRKKGASGGAITALLLGLMERKRIGAAIVVGMNSSRPWIPQVKIATTAQGIIDAAQSKYSMVSVNEALKVLPTLGTDAAVVGLPCHIHGIRKLQKLGHKSVKRVICSIGTFCGFNMEQRATDFLIAKVGVEKEAIRSLEYRGGGHPGGFLVTSKDGSKRFVGKHFYNYLNLMFVPKRCLVCPDLTNEFADISVGDCWNKSLGSQGWSTVIVRTKQGQDVADSAVAANDIVLKAANEQSINAGHAHLFVYKKKGVQIRQKFLRLYPTFHLPTVNSKTSENIFNHMFFFIISFMRLESTIQLFKWLPLSFPGALSKYTRKALNLFFKPASKKGTTGVIGRIRAEWEYSTRKNWTFSDTGAFWDSVTDYDEVNKETYSYFRRFVDGYECVDMPVNSYVLDICSRTGYGTLYFSQKGKVKKAVCADFSRKMQLVCEKRLKESGVNFELKLVSSIPLPFQNEEFDSSLSFETIEHISDVRLFIQELARVTKKNGYIILTTPNILWGPAHNIAAIFNIHHSEGPHRFLTRKKIKGFIRSAGLRIVKEKTTVLIPMGPRLFVRGGEWLEKKTQNTLMRVFGLRRIFICKKQ